MDHGLLLAGLLPVSRLGRRHINRRRRRAHEAPALNNSNGRTREFAVHSLSLTTDEKVTNPSSQLPEIFTTTYQHDGNGNVLEIDESLSDSHQTLRKAQRSYDTFDRLATSTDVHGRALAYAYDAVGNRTRTIDANGVDITHWDYDDLNRNVGVTADNATTKIDYTPSGRVLTITRPDGSTTTSDYDDAGRITRIQHVKGVPLAYTKYAYDLNGNRLTQTQGNGALTQHQLAGVATTDEVTTYTYDSSDWLTDIAVTDSGAHPIRTTHYVLDAVGNRTREQIRDGGGALIGDSTLQYNEREALYSRNDVVTGLHVDLTYDADGNTVSEIYGSSTRRFFYDAHDRMLELYTADNALPLQFDYDASGLRIAKQLSGGAATYYVYDGQSLLAETNTTGNPLAKYHYSATQLLTRTETSGGTRTRQYLLDALNTPIAILTSAGAIDSRTLYDAWGEIVSQQAFDANGSGGAVMTANTDGTYAELPNYDVQDVGFTGYIKDSESGLYYAKARYYDPRIARFTTVDPEEGKAMEPPSLHRYLYAYANPTVYTDPNGREVWDDRMALMNAMAAEDDPTKLAALRKDYGIAESRFNGRFKATMEEVRDTAVGVYQLGKNILKASYEASAVGYFNGAGTEGIDALGNGGKQIVNTIAHPIDKIYTPIHDQYVRANELDAQGNYFEGEYNRQKATLATENVVLTVASIPSAAKSFAKNLSKRFAQLSAADAKLVVETAGGDAALASGAGTLGSPKASPPTVVFAGHGEMRNPFKGFRLTEDQRLTMPEPNHLLQEPSGQALERGGMDELRRQAEIDPRLQRDVDAMRHYGPGDWVPRDPTLLHPKEPGLPPFDAMPSSVTVDVPTNLSVLIGEKPGCYIWAACTIYTDK